MFLVRRWHFDFHDEVGYLNLMTFSWEVWATLSYVCVDYDGSVRLGTIDLYRMLCYFNTTIYVLYGWGNKKKQNTKHTVRQKCSFEA